MHDLIGAYERLEEVYRLYIRSAFPLPVRYQILAEERDTLLRQPGVLSQPPLLETVPVYPSSHMTLVDVADSLPAEYGDLRYLGRGLLPSLDTELYQHQWESLDVVLRQKKDLVVTTGTGSGKTECFLLPLMAQLAAESQYWSACPPPPPNQRWWENDQQEWQAQWGHVQRPMALRGLILYPLNALVEDQLRRLRQTLDSRDTHDWLDQTRGRNRITFGRYTSLTPLPGTMDAQRLRRLGQQLREEMANPYQTVIEGIQHGRFDENARWYFANPNGGEMWSRWDMQATPPDILITNYSMLNIMMMRAIENDIFEQTRRWLAEPDHPERVFHLIIDELHAYRGTPGTEVAYILRLLLHRLGLTPDSPKLRILTTTASLVDDADGRQFLREFFGRDNFAFISGEQVSPQPGSYQTLRYFQDDFAQFAHAVQPDPLNPMAPPPTTTAEVRTAMHALAQRLSGRLDSSLPEEQQLAQALQDVRAGEALRDACQQVNGRVRPTQVPQLDNVLFTAPKAEPHGMSDAIRGLLLAIGMSKMPNSDRSPQPVRGHLFFHNLQNLWACSNPHCTDPDCDRSQGQIPIGALHTTHRLACSCGSRVLDFIVCEVCGDIFLGGHKTEVHQGHYILTADDPDIDHMPERTLSQQNYGQYALFWPQPNGGTEPQHLEWTVDRMRRRWRHARFNPASGVLSLGGRVQAGEVSGWMYVIDSQAQQHDREPALPTRCPRCDADYRYRERNRTPLRSHRTGFQKACQVLASVLLREMQEGSRKLVIFSDSRQDAAKLAAGMERDQYRDLVRMTLTTALDAFWQGLAAFLRPMTQIGIPPHVEQFLAANNPALLAAISQPPQAADTELRAQFNAQHQGVVIEAYPWWLGQPAMNQQAREAWVNMLLDYGGRVPMDGLRGAIFNQLLRLGVNPAGPSSRMLKYRFGDKDYRAWYTCYQWNTPDNIVLPIVPLTEAQRQHLNSMNDTLMQELMYALFPHMARTLEGLGQGWVTFRPQNPLSALQQEALDAVIRLLGVRRRHKYARRYYPDTGEEAERLPRYVQQYISQVGLPPRRGVRLLLDAHAAVPSANGLYVDPDSLYVQRPSNRPQNPDDPQEGYRCPQCNAFYLHAAAGACPECTNSQQAQPLEIGQAVPDFDYYNYLSEDSGRPFRLNSEELTGQTDRRNRDKRQRWFQEIFIGDEIERVHGIDLLSVTTTMEAGVDIGSLLATMLANMPPQRFNYQQRVGRAGRRGAGVSLAVTFCRGRNHDDYYFQRPEKITGDPPPAPYVDMSSQVIIRRVIVKEALRLAFAGVDTDVEYDSVHGEFGDAQTWVRERATVAAWLQNLANRPLLQAVVDALRAQTMWAVANEEPFRTDMIAYLQNQLVTEIDEVVQNPVYTQTPLSEKLANAGLLPMFGFPTRVRLLHTYWPRSARQWPPETGVVDRTLDIAISQFAPGSQTVKDKEVHTACGVVAFIPTGNIVRTEPGFTPALPESNPNLIGLCAHCRAVVPANTAPDLFPPSPFPANQQLALVTCPVCREGDLRPIDAREPQGFFTDLKPEDFDGSFEWQPRSTQPSISFHADPDRIGVQNTRIAAFNDHVLSINDSGGKGGFDFRETSVDGDYKPGAYIIEPENGSHRISVTGFSHRVALLSRRYTDILLVGIREWPLGVFADPTTAEGRAAWYSFAFWLRTVAGVHLDVDPQELQAGFRTLEVGGQPAGEAFLSDQLENGAGYCRFLGQLSEFNDLLLEADVTQRGSIANKWLEHGVDCDTSCHQCLRDYGNMSYHGLLDWRLALDMARLATNAGEIDLITDWGTRSNPWQQTVTNSIPLTMEKLGYHSPTPFGNLRGYVHINQPKLWIEVHPLWQENHAEYQRAWAEALAQHPDYQIQRLNPFRALRRPSDYV